MQSELANWAERTMLGLEDYIVPVKRLWYSHCEENEVPQTTPEELAEILKTDPRFYFVQEPEQEWEESEEEMQRLEKMGFFRGPKVMLQSRIPTKQDLIVAITRNIDKMMLNLRKAYEIRPKDNEQTEDELIDLMLKADNLKKEILKAMSEEDLGETSASNRGQGGGDPDKAPDSQSY